MNTRNYFQAQKQAQVGIENSFSTKKQDVKFNADRAFELSKAYSIMAQESLYNKDYTESYRKHIVELFESKSRMKAKIGGRLLNYFKSL